MAIIKKDINRRMTIDLTGPEGNAHVILGYAHRFCHQMKIDPEPIIEEMTSGDYENLIKVFDKHFGSFCDLER